MSSERPVEGIFTLPGGLMLGDRLLSQAELRPLTGCEEDWLAQHPGLPGAVVATRLLSGCLVRLDDVPASRDLVQRLLVGDRDYLMLQLRRMTLGEKVSAVLACPACGTNMDVDFLVGDVPVERRPQTALVYHCAVQAADGPAHTVRFRLPTGGDQEAILNCAAEEVRERLLARCLVDAGETPLTPDEQASVIGAMEQFAPQLDLELDLTCPECAQTFLTPFDTTAFFCNEISSNARQLLREIHLLAFYYHWSEAEILQLTRARRRAYLALLNESVRQE